MRTGSRLAILLTLALAVACASGTAGTGRTGRSQVGRDQSILTADELRQNQSADLLTTVQSLRPLWLHKRGPVSISSDGDIVVYVDDMRFGTPSSLRSIDISVVQSLQFLTAAQAQARFGIGHPYGAILVFTKRGQRTPG